MRRVEYKIVKDRYSEVRTVQGYFHGFGTMREEFVNGNTVAVGQYTTAIIEHDDGTVANINVTEITFLDTPMGERKNEISK
jgi:hypothetical protein